MPPGSGAPPAPDVMAAYTKSVSSSVSKTLRLKKAVDETKSPTPVFQFTAIEYRPHASYPPSGTLNQRLCVRLVGYISDGVATPVAGVGTGYPMPLAVSVK